MGQVPGNEVSNLAGGYTRKEHRDTGGGFRQGQKASIHPSSLLFIVEIEVEPSLWRYWIDPRMLSSDVQRLAMGFDLAMELLWLVSMMILPQQNGSFFLFSYY